MAAVVDADERVAGRERGVGGDELQVATTPSSRAAAARPAPPDRGGGGSARTARRGPRPAPAAPPGATAAPARSRRRRYPRRCHGETRPTLAADVRGLLDDAAPSAAGRCARTAGAPARRRRRPIRPASTPPSIPATGRRGEVLGTEPMTVGASATGWRVRYRTLDAAGRPVATSMAVAVPAGLAPRPRPVVVWVHGAGGVAPGCGPSRSGLDAWYADDYVRQGVVVVAPDLTGLGMEGTVHPYLHGTTAGRAGARRGPGGRRPDDDRRRVGRRHRRSLGRRPRRAVGQPAGRRRRRRRARRPPRRADVTGRSTSPCRWTTTRGLTARPRSRCSWRRRGRASSRSTRPPCSRRRRSPGSSTSGATASSTSSRSSTVPAERWVRADAFADGAWAAALDAQSAGRAPGRGAGAARPRRRRRRRPRHLVARLAADTGAELREYPGADHMAIGPAARDDVVAAILAALA